MTEEKYFCDVCEKIVDKAKKFNDSYVCKDCLNLIK